MIIENMCLLYKSNEIFLSSRIYFLLWEKLFFWIPVCFVFFFFEKKTFWQKIYFKKKKKTFWNTIYLHKNTAKTWEQTNVKITKKIRVKVIFSNCLRQWYTTVLSSKLLGSKNSGGIFLVKLPRKKSGTFSIKLRNYVFW